MKHLFSKKHISLFIMTLITACLVSGIIIGCQKQTAPASSSNASFEEFTDTLFRQEISANTISLHYTLQDPDSYGILDAPVTYGSFNTSAIEPTAALENCLAVLHSFSAAELSTDNQITYAILEQYLQTALEGSAFSLYEEPLCPLTGIQAQLPILLSEFRLSETKDIDTYLALIKTTPEYFDSLLQFQKARSDSGLFMSDYALDQIITECSSFINMADQNYLYSSFTDRLEDIESLSDSDREQYLVQNTQAIEEYVFPAYQSLIDGLEEFRSTCVNQKGLCYLPDGDKYYNYVVKRETGSSRSIKELKSLTTSQIQSDLSAIQNILTKHPDITAAQTSNISQTNPTSILNELETKMAGVFPDNAKINTRIKYVPEDMQNYVSPAFYLIPTIDNTFDNVIYINPGNTVGGLDLFTTLAHEGYPGHLYQTTYYANTSPAPIRSILNFGGYVEGWATYAEMCSYYLTDLPKEEVTLMQHNSSVILGIYALADIGIHHEGWSLLETVAFFQQYGVSDTETVEQIYYLIIADPANYLKYYIGYLEFLELKKEALTLWGDSFSQEKFHEAVLNIGPAPFDIIRKYAIIP